MKNLHVFFPCLLALGCGAATDTPSSASSGAASSFNQTDLTGSWVGQLTPDDASMSQRLFYFTADADGNAKCAADSIGNEWDLSDSAIVSDLLSDGELAMEINPHSGMKHMQLHGQMSKSLTQTSGTYAFKNAVGELLSGTFSLSLAPDSEYFSELDYSGTWAGGFGVGRRQNERLLTFELSESGEVVSGELVNTVTGDLIHSYSAGAGSFILDDTTVGRINNFVLVADDGAIATCDFLLVGVDLELIAGVGIDSEVGEAMIEIRR
ncbi:MAG: hypothetical protein ACI84O_001491 [Myxococcota bacterium]|jgi:hypothetical protein